LQRPEGADGGAGSGFHAIHDVLAQTGDAVAPPAQAQTSTKDEPFDCYAVAPRSHYYDSGNYAQAFKEIEPLAKEQCPQAAHLLAFMYAKGQGVKPDLVRAYAWLLIAFSEGVTPFGNSGPDVRLLGGDSQEFEIVQFGAQLTEDELLEAEKLASRLVSPRAIATNGAIGPTGIADAVRELRARRARYKLNGKLAALKGKRLSASGRIPAQLVRGPNSEAIPHELQFIETKMKEVALGHNGANRELQRELDLASAQGETIAWLKPGEAVRIIRFGVNAGFASQVELSDGREADPPVQKYWIDSCFLEMKDSKDQQLLQGARRGQCQ
jgi:hypothetical protein